jgi:hypothetical protein
MRIDTSKALLLVIGFGCLQSLSAQTTITFDELGPQPSDFSSTTALTSQYNSLGVTFSGGGAILDENSSFGVNALSGRDFLAFNEFATLSGGGTPSGPETVTFATPVSSVSIYGGDGSSETFSLAGYGAGHTLLASESSPNVGGQYTELSISAPDITSITFGGNGSFYVFDNLTFTPAVSSSVPDGCSTLIGMGIGLAGLIGLRRTMFTRQCQA